MITSAKRGSSARFLCDDETPPLPSTRGLLWRWSPTTRCCMCLLPHFGCHFFVQSHKQRAVIQYSASLSTRVSTAVSTDTVRASPWLKTVTFSATGRHEIWSLSLCHCSPGGTALFVVLEIDNCRRDTAFDNVDSWQTSIQIIHFLVLW